MDQAKKATLPTAVFESLRELCDNRTAKEGILTGLLVTPFVARLNMSPGVKLLRYAAMRPCQVFNSIELFLWLWWHPLEVCFFNTKCGLSAFERAFVLKAPTEHISQVDCHWQV